VRLPATPTKHHPPARQPAGHLREQAPRADDGGVNRAGPSATAASSVFPSACSS
jgi:hypothetical protein